jgi:hypothetical protein
MVEKCILCGSNDLRIAETWSYGSQGPDLLPGTGFLSHAKFEIGVCVSCGYVHWFVRNDDIEKIKSSKKFKSKFDMNR